MEQRWNARMPVRTHVSIRCPDDGMVHGRTRDLSFEGMYVEAPPEKVTSHTFLEVEFVVRDGAKYTPVRVPAMLARTTTDGVGLMFPEYDDKAFDGLALLLARHFSEQQFAVGEQAGVPH